MALSTNSGASVVATPWVTRPKLLGFRPEMPHCADERAELREEQGQATRMPIAT